MNTSQINGAVLGNGNSSPAVFLVFGTVVRATTTAFLITYKYLTGATVSKVTSVFGMSGTIQLSGGTIATASATIDLRGIRPNDLNAIGTTARVTSSIALTAIVHVTCATLARATTTMLVGAIGNIPMSTTARATTAIAIISTGKPAADDRVMRIPYEDRTMVI